MAHRVPAAKLGVPGRYFVQTGETTGLTRMFSAFLAPPAVYLACSQTLGGFSCTATETPA